MSESLSFNRSKVTTESLSITESGVIDLPLYIDATYFASDYIQTTQTF